MGSLITSDIKPENPKKAVKKSKKVRKLPVLLSNFEPQKV